MTALIELEHVVKDYPMGAGVFRALHGVDLQISEHDYMAVTGASGSGKSTLLHVIGALHRPTEGHAWIDGQDLGKLTREELARIRNAKIGFIFQQYFLLARVSALHNVELPLIYAGRRPRERQARAKECLVRVGLLDRASHLPSQLSGGESQRVAIARALANHPRIILGDEPTGNLDSRTTTEILELFQSLHDEGRTIVLVTHEREIASQVKRRIVLRDGRIEEDRHGFS